jgi:uncharacterized protein YjgD (DUF1641 family)
VQQVDNDLDLDGNDGNDGSANDGNGMKALRQQLKKLQKDAEDREKELETFRSKARTSTISDVLKEAKAPEKLARFVARDLEGDITEEAVKKWLADNGDVFGWSPDDSDDGVDPATAAAASRISQATNNAPEPVTGTPTVEQLRSADYDTLIRLGIVDKRR